MHISEVARAIKGPPNMQHTAIACRFSMAHNPYVIAASQIRNTDWYVIDEDHEVIHQCSDESPPLAKTGQYVVRGFQAKQLDPPIWRMPIPAFISRDM